MALLAGVSVVSIGGAATAGEAARLGSDREVLYTLKVTLAAKHDRRDISVGALKGSVIFEAHRKTVYTSESVRPFAFKQIAVDGRRPTYFFQTKLGGSLTHVGNGRIIVTRDCFSRFTERNAVSKAVGSASLDGRSPARIRIDLSPTEETDAVIQSWPPSCGDEGAVNRESTLVWEPATTKAIDLSKRYGRAFTLTHQEHRTSKSFDAADVENRYSYVWKLKFTPLRQATSERWQIDIRGRDRSSTGRWPRLGAGVWVDWRHRTVLEVKDGQVDSATGKVTVTRITPFSDPPGVFRGVKRGAKTAPVYKLKKATKSGNLVTLGLRRDPGSRYTVNYSFRVVGSKALERLRAAGVPNPEVRYREMVQHGTYTASEVLDAPADARLVIRLRPGSSTREPDSFHEGLRCDVFGADEKDCFLTRGGEQITVRKLR